VDEPSIDPDVLRTALRSEQRSIVRQLNAGEHIPRFLIILVLARIAWGEDNDAAVAAWAGVMFFLPGPALLRPRWFYALSDARFWPAYTFIGVAHPVGWALLPGLVLGASSNAHFLLVFIICLISFIRTRVASYNPPEIYAQGICGFSLLILWALLRVGPWRWAEVAALLGMATILVSWGRAVNTQFVQMVTLSCRNAQLTKQLQRANSAQTRFLAAASHDLRQPVHSLGLLVGMLESRVRAQGESEIVTRIRGTVDAMEALLDAILNISRLDAQVEAPDLRPVALNHLYQHLDRSFAAVAAQAGLALRFHGRNWWILTDEYLLLRILNNLVGNALRYTRSGGVLVAGRRRGARLLIEVWDTGMGIPPERQEDVFQEFVQLQNPHRDRRQGLGLGLAIVRRTAELLRHDLGLQSRPGRGTVVRLWVPIVELPRVSPQDAEQQATLDVAGLYVLFVDDEQDVRYAMQGLLTDWGCTVVTAASAQEAVAQLVHRLRTPDAVVLDFRLPDANGLDLAKDLRSRADRVLPTLVVTGDVTQGPLKLLEESGFPVMHKPVNPVVLRRWLAGVKETSSIAGA
jgi:signal transduction histidine kinase/CheY-like chemotaxis protein